MEPGTWACDGKHGYDSYAMAEKRTRRKKFRHAKKGKGSMGNRFSDLKLHVYRCRFCHCWHIGNASKPR